MWHSLRRSGAASFNLDAVKKQKSKKGGLYNFTNQVFFYRRSLFDPDRILNPGKLLPD